MLLWSRIWSKNRLLCDILRNLSQPFESVCSSDVRNQSPAIFCDQGPKKHRQECSPGSSSRWPSPPGSSPPHTPPTGAWPSWAPAEVDRTPYNTQFCPSKLLYSYKMIRVCYYDSQPLSLALKLLTLSSEVKEVSKKLTSCDRSVMNFELQR